jgi:hypothetical protein
MLRIETGAPTGGRETTTTTATTARRIGLRGFLLLFAIGAVAGVAAMILLPHDKYLRYQALNDRVAPTAYWVYERIHDDPTPIDVAFIGDSRTGLSVHTARLEQDLASRGVVAKAANLHIVKNGRNMQYVIAKELLTHRKVKLLVVEMIEWEDRKPHPDFIFLADPIDVIDAPLLINLNYFSDLGRLAGRQVDLFLDTELQRRGLHTPDFVPPPYEGPNLDHAQFIQTLDGVKHYRDQAHTEAEMEQFRIKQDSEITPAVLPAALSGLEYRLPRYYVDKILDLAREHDTKVVFLYTPRYGGPQEPPPYQRYAGRVDLINPWPQLQDYRFWEDATHVDWQGSQRLTDYVADALAARPELR